MPTSRSVKPGIKPAAPPPRLLLPLVGVAAITVLAVIVATLPAATLKRFLPPAVMASDFSGTLWHGSAGHLTVDARDAGAVEWRLHPLALLTLSLSADLHWVKTGFVADATVDLDRDSIVLRNVQGDGPIEDLASLGVPPGWHGTASLKFSSLRAALHAGGATLVAAVGDLSVANLAAAQIASGADLGGYVLHMANGSVTSEAEANAELSDTGGPLELHATLHFAGHDRTGMLLGTLRARPQAPPALRAQIDNLAQLHPLDGQGRVPVELEFTL